MSGTVLFILIIAVAAVAIQKSGLLKQLVGQGGANTQKDWPVYAKRLLTPTEEKCFYRLCSAFPDDVVLTQVSLSQLLGIKKGQGKNYQAILNRYRQLTADFVICNREFVPVSVFELDDRTHDNPARQDSDARKSAALAAAGIPLHRLNSAQLPSEADLRKLRPGNSG